jgi:ferritin
MTELETFEKITGVKFTPEFLKSRKNENVDHRDLFVSLIIRNNSNVELNRIAKIINKDRATIRFSQIRFKDRYSTDKYYKIYADYITNKFKLNLLQIN